MRKSMNTFVNIILIAVVLYAGYQIFAPMFFQSDTSSGGSSSYQRITPEKAKERLDKEEGIILLDVRTVQEYEQGHIPGSLLIPLQVLKQEVIDQIPDKDTTIFVICRTGSRSRDAMRILADLGYQNIFDLGGIVSWPYEIVSGK